MVGKEGNYGMCISMTVDVKMEGTKKEKVPYIKNHKIVS